MNQGCFLSDIHIQQLGSIHNISLKSTSRNHIQGPSPMTHRIAWLLSMCFSAYDPDRLHPMLRRFGWHTNEDEVHKEGLHYQFSWMNTDFVRAFVAEQREFSLQVCVQLNTQLLGWIRAKAIRNPEIIQALMLRPTCSFRLSILIDNLYSTASCSYSDIGLGDWNIPISERPPWVELLIDHLQGLFCYPNSLNIAALAKKALLSPYHHDAYHKFCQALEDIGAVRVVEGTDGSPFLLLRDEPLVLHSPQVQRAAMQACGIYVSGASVIWIDDDVLCAFDDATQIWLACAKGEEVGQQSKKKALSWKERK